MNSRTFITWAMLPLAIAACSPDTSDKVAKKTNEMADKTANAAQEAGRKIENAAQDASRKIETATQDAGRKLEDATAQAKDAASDAAITASIKADLVKDPGLSAIKIEVDTRDGVVTLNGVAPDKAAADRAGKIAIAVAGVKEVRNHVVVKQG
jgi:osmotically-inducible protein OsmY